MRVTAVLAKQNESGSAGLSGALENGGTGARMTSLRGLPLPTPGACAIAGANLGENRLICNPRQATMRSDGRTLGECRLKERRAARLECAASTAHVPL